VYSLLCKLNLHEIVFLATGPKSCEDDILATTKT